MRLIDTDDLLKVPNVRKVTEYDETGEGITYLAVPVEAIENAPTIEAEPVRHGKWEWFEDWGEMPTSCLSPQEPPELYDYGWRCSCCKEYISSAVDVRNIWDDPDEEPVIKHCPNCGAKMDLEG